MSRMSAAFLLCLGGFASAAEWTPALQMQFRTVGEVVPSPDGKLAVWTETRAVIDTEKSENLTHIFVAMIDGSRRFQLTRGDKSANSPQFSPDSRSVYFSSERSGKKNIWRIPIEAGEAEQITNWQGTLGNYKLSPDGKWIAFTATEQDSARERARREKRDMRVVDEDAPNQSLWVIAAEPGKQPRKIASGPWHIGAFDWSPDSLRIAFEHRPTPDADNMRRSDISEVTVENSVITALASTGAAESQPLYSPDSRYIAFVRSADPPTRLTPNRVVLHARGSGSVRELAATPDEAPSLVDWSPDSRRIYFSEPRGTRGAIYSLPVDGPPVAAYRPSRGTLGLGTRISGNVAGFSRQSPEEPAEAFILKLDGGEPMQVSRANAHIEKPLLGETRIVSWKSKDGAEVEGLLTLPVNYKTGTRVPLILNIHGGPAGVFAETFTGGPGLYPIATFAAKGIAVLRPNPRGSTGYGGNFRRANLNDWGGGDYNDLMSGVDHMIAQGIADPARLAVMGWSYGGYMTAWVVTQTGRFKAGAVGAGLTNLWSMWGTNDIPSVLNDYFNGPPWESFDLYRDRSAMAHISKVTTPTLFLHGEVDLRVPISQAQEMYSALKRRGVATKMVVYPRTAHGPQEPKFVQNVMQQHLDWVEAHLK